VVHGCLQPVKKSLPAMLLKLKLTDD